MNDGDGFACGTAALLAMLVAAAWRTPVVGTTEIPGGKPAQHEAG